MRLWRRSAPVPVPSMQLDVAPRVERAVVALAFHAQQIDDRLGRLERRLDEDPGSVAPTQEDLLDVRLHSARVAAELARVSVELRAEIERATRVSAVRNARRDAIADTVIDLNDRMDTLPSDLYDGRGRAAG